MQGSPRSSPKALDRSQGQFTPIQGRSGETSFGSGKDEGLAFSFKEIMLPGFLYPQSYPTPDFPLSFRIPCSWSEAKRKGKVAHSRGGWSGGMPEEGRASPSSALPSPGLDHRRDPGGEV